MSDLFEESPAVKITVMLRELLEQYERIMVDNHERIKELERKVHELKTSVELKPYKWEVKDRYGNIGY